jgi:hypothetical protein
MERKKDEMLVEKGESKKNLKLEETKQNDTSVLFFDILAKD